VTAFLGACGAIYVRGWYCLGRDLPRAVASWRLAAFSGGIAALWIAVASPATHMDHHLLTAHMVKHLLIMLVAAPLILLGAPAIVLMHGMPQRLVRVAVTLFRRVSGLRLLGMVCTHPVFCWLAGSVTVIVWHVPAVFELALHSQHWHALEQASFFLAGILFWWPVIQPWPSIANSLSWSAPFYLFLAALPCDALSAFLAFCGHVVYRPYLSAQGAFGLSPLEDQALAGALMWVTATFAYLVPALVVTSQLISGERRRNAEVGTF